MRRLLIIALVPVLTAAGGGSVARAAAPAPEKTPLDARLTACETGAEPSARAATFTGSMPALTGTRRMQMRFALLQRLGVKGVFKPIDVPGWGAWERADPGRPGFIFGKRVESLVAPAAYKATVTFRWYDKKGHLQRQTIRTTAACTQPDTRPDLVLDSFTAARSGKDQAVYSVVVSNQGLSSAGVFGVALSIDGAPTDPIALGPLAAGDRAQGTIAGPSCAPGGTVTIRLDPADAVDEADETNNVVERPCPL
jgi:hypothetical protein